MDNYICINGKKAELTEEQMKALGIELPKKNPFERLPKTKPFYYITNKGNVEFGVEAKDFHCQQLHNVGNYCTDKAIMEQRALHEILNRLLWRYSMEHGGDKIDWGNVSDKYAIYYESDTKKYKVACWQTVYYSGNVYFRTENVALAAIEAIINPFIAAHPEFKF